jgi:hypothetical protein
MKSKRVIFKVVVLALVIGVTMVMIGCKTTTAAETTAATTTAAAVTTAEAVNHSNSWYFANKSGYTYTFTIKIWEPILDAESGVSVHPANTDSVLGGACEFDPVTDLAIPGQYAVEYTTEKFSSDNIEVYMLFLNDLSTGPYSGPGVPPAQGDNRLSVEQFYLDGPICENYSSTGWGPSNFGGKWADYSFSYGQIGAAGFFIIVHDYFSPVTPNGDTALLDWIIIRPMAINVIDGFKDTDDRSSFPYSYVGMTLSGKVVMPQK